MAGETKKIQLVRDIILAGEHAEEGSVHEVGRALAHRLIGEGSAVHHLEEGEEPEAGPTSVNRMETASHADPKPRQIKPAHPKVKEK